MQITAIKVNNLIGSRRADLQLTTPVTLFCGANGASKSSIQESIRMAFTGKTLRVGLKKEYPLLVSDGAKTGKVTVQTDIGTATFELPSGTHVLEGDLKLGLPDALEYVLNAQSFSSLTPEARRAFLFGLTGCKITAGEVKRRLLEKNCEEAKIELTLPMLRAGFPEASDFAAKKATELKGEWKATAGETWGGKKGLDWVSEKPEYDQAEIDSTNDALCNIDAQMEELNQKLGAEQLNQRVIDKKSEEFNKNQELAQKLDRLKTKLELDEKSLAEQETNVVVLTGKAGKGKKVGLIHDFARYVNSFDFNDDEPEGPELLARYTTEYGSISGEGDPEASAQLPAVTKARDMMKNAVQNGQRDLINAENAVKWLADNQNETAQRQEDVIVNLQEKIAKLRTERLDLAQKYDALKAISIKAENAEKNTITAKKIHTQIEQWLLIATSLAPDGIPAEMLAQALRPINTLLKKSSIETGWRATIITPDMGITAEGRPYNLLSKSEKWRVDAMIAQAISEISGVKIFMLDEVDILELDARSELLCWISALAEDGAINNALLFGTWKNKPTGLPENICAVWLENGVIPEIEQAEQQVA